MSSRPNSTDDSVGPLFTAIQPGLEGSTHRTLVRDKTTQCLHVLSVRPLAPEVPYSVVSYYTRVLPKIRHDHLIRYDDAYSEPPNSFITVAEYFSREKRWPADGLSPEDVLGLQEALSVLHSHGIAHGAVREENVYWRDDGRAVLGYIAEEASMRCFGSSSSSSPEAMQRDLEDVMKLAMTTKVPSRMPSPAFTVSPASHISGEEDLMALTGYMPVEVPEQIEGSGSSNSLTLGSPTPAALSPTSHTLRDNNPFWYSGDAVDGDTALERSLYAKQRDELSRRIEWERQFCKNQPLTTNQRKPKTKEKVCIRNCCAVM